MEGGPLISFRITTEKTNGKTEGSSMVYQEGPTPFYIIVVVPI